MQTARTFFGVHPGSARLAAVTVALGILPIGAGCGFNSSFVPQHSIYEGVAIVRNGEGAEVAVSASGDSLFAEEPFVLAPAALQEPDAAARDLFLSAIARRLSVGGDDLFQARFGPGPWCLVSEPALVRTVGRTRTQTIETGPPLPPCDGPPPPPQCSGPGTSPELRADPDAFEFGGVPLGPMVPATIPITLSNLGTGHLCLASIIAGGRDAADFRVDDSDCRPGSPAQSRRLLGEGASPSCRVDVTFDPTRPGRREGTLRVSSNDPQVIREFPLSGTGLPGALSPLAPICVPRAGSCYRRTVVLTNTGPGVVTMRSVWVGGYFFRSLCTPDYDAVIPVGGVITCPIDSCDADPQPSPLIVSSDAVGVDPTATVIEIPLIPQVTPETCTP
jgi:hypothetical protein